MRLTKLFYTSLFVWVSLVVLVASFRIELEWASRALPSALAGGAPILPEKALFDQAAREMNAGADPARIRALLKRAIAIDPNSMARVALGEQYRRDGDPERALEHLRRYLEIDPTDLYSYVRAAEIYQQAGRSEDRRQVIEMGLAYFEDHTEGQRPVHDNSVDPKYNEKALSVYRKHQHALRVLRERL